MAENIGYSPSGEFADAQVRGRLRPGNSAPALRVPPPDSAPPHPASPAGCVVWFTGLPAAGKTTLATAVERRLRDAGRRVVRLDGDELRRTLCADLGYSPADRAENIRRAAGLARRHALAGAICLAAFISPLHAHRAVARRTVAPLRFIEVHVDASVATCRTRDPKGNYARALRGELPDYTGVSAPYEIPDHPDVTVHTDRASIETCTEQILAALPPPRLTRFPRRASSAPCRASPAC